jgi:outer membrane protein
MKRFFIAFFVAGHLAAVNAATDETQQLTLRQAWTIALQNHPQIQSGELKARAAEEDITIARSNYFPQISGDAVRAVASDGTRLAAAGGINNPLIIDRGSYGVSVNQLITDFGRTASRLEAAKAGAEAQSARTEDTRELVLFEVTRAYYNVLRAQALLQVADSTLAARNELLDKVTSLREAGIKSDLDVSFARRDADETEQLRLQAQNGVTDAMATLSQTLGYGEQKEFALEKTIPTIPPTQFGDLLRAALGQNPELLALKADADAAQRNYEAERAANYPTVNAVAYSGATPIREAGTIDSNYSAAGITVDIPIFTGGRLSAASRRAELRAEAAQRDLEEKRNEIMRDLRISWDGTQTAYKNIAVEKQVLTSASKALELIQASYDLGRSSIVDLTQAQLEETRVEIDNSNAIYDYLIQRALLDYKVGDLSPTP